MTVNPFPVLCRELGYDPERVLSVRVAAHQVVIVERTLDGELRVTNHEHIDGGERTLVTGLQRGA